MGISSKKASRKPVRSVSFPCRSHPNTDKMEKMLNKVNTWESTLSSSNPSADMICSGFTHLTALYECLEDLFNSNLSQTSSHFNNHNIKWTDEILDVSVMLLDLCSNTGDVMSQTKQLVRDFGCDLRRNIGGCSTERNIAKYIEFRNKLKKELKGSMGSLKQVDNMIRGCPSMVDSEKYHQMWVVSVFKEVTAFSIVIFRLLLEFLSVPCMRTGRTGRWTAISRFLSSGKVVPEDEAGTTANELQHLNAVLLRYCSSEKQEFLQVVPKNLEVLEATLECIDSHQHSMSRRLIRTRASILNMVSFY